MKNNNKRKRKFKSMCSDKSDTFSNAANKKKKKVKKIFSADRKNDDKINDGTSHNENLKNNEDGPSEINTIEKAKNGLKNSLNLKNGDNKIFAKLTHKGCSGANNWEKFLTVQGKQIVKSENPTVSNNKTNTKINNDLNKNPKLTKVIGMDCEMVGIGEEGKDNLLARVSIVNLYGDCLLDKFVKPSEKVIDYRTSISGVRAKDLKNADNFNTVQKEVADIIKSKILVGHAIKNDLEVLYLTHPRHLIRDTAKFFRKKGSGTPSLKNLAEEYLNVKIQSGEHSSVQDAQAAVHLYSMFRKQWESGGGNKKNNRIDTTRS